MQDLKQLLADCGALLEGHFQLTSGRHSDRYVEKFRLIEQPRYLDEAAQAMVAGIDPDSVDIVLGAAVGGILIAGAVARHLDRRTMFTERVDGVMTLRRGFELGPQDRVLIVEDIVSTGGSVVELINVAQAAGATIVQVSCLVDRTLDGIKFDVPSKALLRMPIASWEPEECPLCKEGIPIQNRGRSGKK
ncbi:orotate phosphoribosyltransferase [Candidatus Neomarinimicrobiota bacterium]